MNQKTATLIALILLSGVGCGTLPRPEPSSAGSLPEGRRVALASGPAIVHLSSSGSGTATVYLADDPGDGSSTCSAAGAEDDGSIKVLSDDDYVGDLPVPRGKRICVVLDSPELSLDWLAEDYSPSESPSGGPPAEPPPSPPGSFHMTLIAGR